MSSPWAGTQDEEFHAPAYPTLICHLAVVSLLTAKIKRDGIDHYRLSEIANLWV